MATMGEWRDRLCYLKVTFTEASQTVLTFELYSMSPLVKLCDSLMQISDSLCAATSM